MAQKAKIVFVNDTCIIVDKTVDEVNKAIAAGGVVEFPVSEKKYNYALNTINIGEKTVPAYDVTETTKAVNTALIARVEAADIKFAESYTGTGELPDATDGNKDASSSTSGTTDEGQSKNDHTVDNSSELSD